MKLPDEFVFRHVTNRGDRESIRYRARLSDGKYRLYMEDGPEEVLSRYHAGQYLSSDHPKDVKKFIQQKMWVIVEEIDNEQDQGEPEGLNIHDIL